MNGQDILTSQPALKERPYTVPDGYFEAFKAEAISKSSISAAKPLSKLVPYLAVAASICHSAEKASTPFLKKTIFSSQTTC